MLGVSLRFLPRRGITAPRVVVVGTTIAGATASGAMMVMRVGVVMVTPPQTRVGAGGVAFVFVLLLLLPGRPIVLFMIDADESSHELPINR